LTIIKLLTLIIVFVLGNFQQPTRRSSPRKRAQVTPVTTAKANTKAAKRTLGFSGDYLDADNQQPNKMKKKKTNNEESSKRNTSKTSSSKSSNSSSHKKRKSAANDGE
jgi:Tfp pilus assembly protein PilV